MTPHARGKWWLWLCLLAVAVVTVGILASRSSTTSASSVPPTAASISTSTPTQSTNAHIDVSVTTDLASPLGRSQFSPGFSYVDNSLDSTSSVNSQAAIQHVTTLLHDSVTFQNTPIMGWGLPDPWPDPTNSEPSDWGALDARLQLVANTGGIPVLTLCEAPWWMKGQLQADGTTIALTQTDEWSDRAFASRILDDKMDAWLHLVQRVAERYMAPPYNVRYFQVWNELKGYYNPATNNYDYTTSAGHPDQPSATHGYTYMYNLVYERLLSVADSLGIPHGAIQVGGPYPVMDTWSSANQSNPSTLTKAYGTFDQRPLDVVKYWLQHKEGAGFISIDGDSENKDGVNIANASVAAEKFADLVRWIRSLDNSVYPGAATLPIWLAEWYARPYTDWANNDHSNAIKTVAMMDFLNAGGAVALAWGGSDEDRSGPRLWTNTVHGGGEALPFDSSYKDFKQYFAPGAQLYQTTISPDGLVDAVATSSTVMLVNKTPNAVVASVNGKTVPLAPYQVSLVHASS